MTSQVEIPIESRPLDISSVPTDTLYIGAAGFEDRALAFLTIAERANKSLKSCMGIEYRPFDLRNRKDEFAAKASNVFKTVEWVVYDRSSPNEFNEKLESIQRIASSFSLILVDISAMSKMLIVVLLYGLRQLDRPLKLIYVRADVYHPTKEEFEAETVHPDKSPVFLTSDVYRVVTVTPLSSISMQGAPLAMVAFPNFNYLELAALLNEMNFQDLILIADHPRKTEESWRLAAVKKLNKNLRSYLEPVWKEIDAQDLKSNLALLENIYAEFSKTHKVVVAPTGGKIQAVATFMLKCMHPDVHIVYPVVKRFAEDYTDGQQDPVEFAYANFRSFVQGLDRYRIKDLITMKEEVETSLLPTGSQ